MRAGLRAPDEGLPAAQLMKSPVYIFPFPEVPPGKGLWEPIFAAWLFLPNIPLPSASCAGRQIEQGSHSSSCLMKFLHIINISGGTNLWLIAATQAK